MLKCSWCSLIGWKVSGKREKLFLLTVLAQIMKILVYSLKNIETTLSWASVDVVVEIYWKRTRARNWERKMYSTLLCICNITIYYLMEFIVSMYFRINCQVKIYSVAQFKFLECAMFNNWYQNLFDGWFKLFNLLQYIKVLFIIIHYIMNECKKSFYIL